MVHRDEKACVDCGKVVLMYPFQQRCKMCGYLHHLQKVKERYREKKECKKIYSVDKSKNWPVKFIEVEGGYIWKVTFLNKVTERLVTIGAVKVFKDLDSARQDYVKAMR